MMQTPEDTPFPKINFTLARGTMLTRVTIGTVEMYFSESLLVRTRSMRANDNTDMMLDMASLNRHFPDTYKKATRLKINELHFRTMMMLKDDAERYAETYVVRVMGT